MSVENSWFTQISIKSIKLIQCMELCIPPVADLHLRMRELTHSPKNYIRMSLLIVNFIIIMCVPTNLAFKALLQAIATWCWQCVLWVGFMRVCANCFTTDSFLCVECSHIHYWCCKLLIIQSSFYCTPFWITIILFQNNYCVSTCTTAECINVVILSWFKPGIIIVLITFDLTCLFLKRFLLSFLMFLHN